MNITLSTGENSFIVSESRLGRIISQEKEQATHLGLWNKIKDYFRSEKKQDVLNELYNLTHQNDSSKSETLKERIAVFNKIKAMSEPAFQHLFRIENYSYENHITFCAGTTFLYQQDLDTLSAEDKLALTRSRMAQINANQDLKQDCVTDMQSHIDDRLQRPRNFDEAAVYFQNKGGWSCGYTSVTIAENKGVDLEENKKSPISFIKNLTPLQKAGMNMTGLNHAFFGLLKTVSYRVTPFVFLQNPYQHAEYSFDEKSGELKMHCIIRQNTDNLKFMYPGERPNRTNEPWFNDLRLAAMFTIAKNGSVTCTDFNLSSKKIDDDGSQYTHKSDQDAGIERKDLLSAKLDQGGVINMA